jgi:hypothetical protein
MELLILLVIGLFCIGVPAAAIVSLVVFLRKEDAGKGQPSYAELVEENRRLREELAALRREAR